MKISRRLLSLSAALFLGPACQGEGGDDGARAKMATDLVQCQNDRSSLRDKISDLTTELQKLKADADKTEHLDPIELRAQPDGSGGKHAGGGSNIAPEAVTQVLKRNSAGLRFCYERGLKRNPNLQYVSLVNVRFSVKNTGSAENVGFSPHTDPEMERCMGAAITKWQFPSFSGDTIAVEAPVNLVAK